MYWYQFQPYFYPICYQNIQYFYCNQVNSNENYISFDFKDKLK